jgi:hypothetical protein
MGADRSMPVGRKRAIGTEFTPQGLTMPNWDAGGPLGKGGAF